MPGAGIRPGDVVRAAFAYRIALLAWPATLTVGVLACLFQLALWIDAGRAPVVMASEYTASVALAIAGQL